MLSLRGLLVDNLPFNVFGPRRVITAVFGAFLCLVMVKLLDGARNPVARIAIGLIGALCMSVAISVFFSLLNRVILPVPDRAPLRLADSVQWMLVWFGYFLAWTGTQLALSYHWAVQDEQMRARQLAAATQRAELAALRYQLNPHFLFNALNSLSSLVMEERRDVAEQALLKMAEFVRATLTSAPAGTIPLSEEIRLQQIYLEVEQLRFDARIQIDIDVPPNVQAVKVPALILQPLVENAVRHGVAHTEEAVRISIRAEEEDDNVRITVEDDAGRGDNEERPSRKGLGVGLNNVAQRLELQYGGKAALETRTGREHGYRAVITLPAIEHD